MEVKIPCRGELLRGRFSHSWLDHQILEKTGKDILYLAERGRWTALDKEFPVNIQQMRAFVDDLMAAYSPVQLLDWLEPCHSLMQEQWKSLRRRLHEQYVEAKPFHSRVEPLHCAVTRLESALENLTEVWSDAAMPESRERMLAAWAMVHESAEELQGLLKALPRGVLVP